MFISYLRGKFHLHHSHITGEIFGYAHDFCNIMLAERETFEITSMAHNMFGFHLFYFLRACSKELDIRGNSLAQANYGNIGGEIKLIDSLKFYQEA